MLIINGMKEGTNHNKNCLIHLEKQGFKKKILVWSIDQGT